MAGLSCNQEPLFDQGNFDKLTCGGVITWELTSTDKSAHGWGKQPRDPKPKSLPKWTLLNGTGCLPSTTQTTCPNFRDLVLRIDLSVGDPFIVPHPCTHDNRKNTPFRTISELGAWTPATCHRHFRVSMGWLKELVIMPRRPSSRIAGASHWRHGMPCNHSAREEKTRLHAPVQNLKQELDGVEDLVFFNGPT